MNRLNILILLGFWAGGIAAGHAAGTVTYQADPRVLTIAGFPEDAPATMDTLLQADQQNKWGVVSYDKASDTYRVDASLYIGTNTDLGTYVQVGRKDHPKETVVVKGDIWIKCPKKSIVRSDGQMAIANRLTLGYPKDPAITAMLKIDCAKPGEYALVMGTRSKTEWKPGGDLYVYHSTLAAATTGAQHRVGCSKVFGDDVPAWYASRVRLIQAQVSGLIGPLYGLSSENSVIEDSVFEDMGTVLQNGNQIVRNCTFRNCGTVFAEGGCLYVRAVNCVFEGNDANWTAGGSSGRGVNFIGGQVGPQKNPPALSKNNLTPENAVRQRLPIYPAYTEWLVLPVQVAGPRGKPVGGVFVNVSCVDDPAAVQNGFAMTDAGGLTPADLDKRAILVIRRKLVATDNPKQPQIVPLVYTIAVQAPGYREQKLALSNGQDIPRPLIVKLARQGCGGCARKP